MKEVFILFLVFGVIVFGVDSCNKSDWNQKNEQAAQKRRIAEETPHVIRRVDGCEVYEFLADGRNKYFTRCADKVTTQSDYTVNCGKGCSRNESDIIETVK